MWCHEFKSEFIRQDLHIGKHCARDLCELFRGICKKEYCSSEKIGGPGNVVQIDESHLYNRKYNVGRMLSTQVWVFGGIDDTGKIFMERVERRDAETLTEVLLRRVHPGSTIYSDSWKGYNHVKDHFQHFQVNHRKNFVNPDDGANTQRIEATWGVLKRMLKMKGTRKFDDLEGYLAVLMYRKQKEGDPFHIFLTLLKKHTTPYPH